MAYKTSELKKRAVTAIENKRFIFFEDIYSSLGISRSTFYEHFPKESEGYNDLDRLLQENKISMKGGMRRKWYESDNASLQISLYKILGSEEEVQRLNGGKPEVVEKSVTITVKSKEEAKELADELL